MEVKEGYRLTEAGIIPNDWKVQKLGTLIKIIGGGAFKSSDSRSSGIKWLKISNVGINQTIWDETSYLPTELIKNNEKFVLRECDYVIALTRPLLNGKLKIAKLGKADVPALLNQRVGKVEIERNNNIDFVYYVFQKFEIINALNQSMAGTDPPNLGNRGIYNTNCAVPPNIEEQNEIATALSDTDALISSLEKLVAKKRNIRQGAMQELLKPKKDWKAKMLGDLCISISSGRSETKSNTGKYPIYGSTGIIGSRHSFDYQGTKILVARVGANAGVVNIVRGKYSVSDNALILSYDEKYINTYYLYYNFSSVRLN